MEGALDGVLRGLVAQHGHRRVDVGATAGLHRDVEELPADHLGAAVVEHLERRPPRARRQAAPAQQLVGPGQQQVAEQDRRGGAVLLRVAAPRPRPVRGREGAVRGRAAAAGVGGVHVVVVDQRAGVQQLQRGTRTQQRVLVGRPRAHRPVAPPAEGGPEALAAGHAAPGLLEQVRGVGAERSDPLGPSRRGTRRGSSATARGRPSPPVTRPTTSWFEASGPLAPSLRPCRGRSTSRKSVGELVREGERSISFEFMPPKDDAGVEQLWSAIRELEPYQPTFVSVTYGAGGSTRDTTVAITGRIARETTLRADGPPDVRRPLPGGAARHPGVLPRRRRPRRARAARRPQGGPRADVDAHPRRPDLRQRAGGAGPRAGRLQRRGGGLPRGPPVGGLEGRRRPGAGGQGRGGRGVRDHPAVLPRRRLRRPRRPGPRARLRPADPAGHHADHQPQARSAGWPSFSGADLPDEVAVAVRRHASSRPTYAAWASRSPPSCASRCSSWARRGCTSTRSTGRGRRWRSSRRCGSRSR